MRNGALVVDRDWLLGIDIRSVGVGRGVSEFHFLRLDIVDMERGDVFRNVRAAERYGDGVAQEVLIIYGDCRSAGAKVGEDTSRAPLDVGEDIVGEGHRGEIVSRLGHSCLLETFVEVAAVGVAPDDVEESALYTVALYAYRVELVL